MDLPANPWALSFLLCSVLLAASTSQSLRGLVHHLFSAFVNRILCNLNYIVSADGKGKQIPTCPYSFPNGQGDIGKFFDGHENREAWSQTHGKLYRIWMGTRPEVVLGDPSDVQTVFRDSDTHLKAPNNNSGWILGGLLGECLGLISGARWKRLRAVLDEQWNARHIAALADDTTRAVAHYFSSVTALQAAGAGTPSPTSTTSSTPSSPPPDALLHPINDLKYLPFTIIARKLFGPLSLELETELYSLIPLRDSLFRLAMAGGLLRFSVTAHLPTQARRDMRAYQRRWAAFNDSACERARAALRDGKSSHEHTPDIMRIYEAVEAGTVARVEALHTIDEILFANLDVTVGALSWVLVMLAAAPDHQDKLRREVVLRHTEPSKAAAAGDADAADAAAQYLVDQKSFLHFSMLEAGRLKPLAPFSVSQAAQEPKVVGGFVVPPGTDFVVDAAGVNIKNDFWGKDTDVFRPERFEKLSNSPKMRYQYWRFGFGPRQCLGKYLADMTIKATVIYLLERYRLRLPVTDGVKGDDLMRRMDEVWITQADMALKVERL